MSDDKLRRLAEFWRDKPSSVPSEIVVAIGRDRFEGCEEAVAVATCEAIKPQAAKVVLSLLDRLAAAESALADARLLAHMSNSSIVVWGCDDVPYFRIHCKIYEPIEFRDGLPVLTDEMRGRLRELLNER